MTESHTKLPEIPILYRDEHLIVVHKPSGLLMHRSPISQDTVFLLQTLRDQIGQRVYPVHRLDRATSGVLLLGLNPDIARELVTQFESHQINKSYHALVRGWADDEGEINHPVADEEGNNVLQEAVTRYRCLERVELPVAIGRYPTSRYSIVEAEPLTGRRQQIRKHFKHISHHIIGDTTHGDGKHNNYFREHHGIFRLMLTSKQLGFTHPVTLEKIRCDALDELEWQRLNSIFK